MALLVLVGLLYYRPLRAYVQARGELQQRTVEVRSLQAKKQQLERRLKAAQTPATLAREARALGFVRPGEHLYIVKGIDAWRRRQRTSIPPHGRR